MIWESLENGKEKARSYQALTGIGCKKRSSVNWPIIHCMTWKGEAKQWLIFWAQNAVNGYSCMKTGGPRPWAYDKHRHILKSRTHFAIVETWFSKWIWVKSESAEKRWKLWCWRDEVSWVTEMKPINPKNQPEYSEVWTRLQYFGHLM